ncbi:ABC transporter ATP-binding protein [Hahella ganghwensis]|uniref:ABC transporter ATP-binding protein n=1 Tax=Hahella ganghwensis TaxID=286420 RepID=UPI0003708718|nr:sn-glycerol-3-phosphate ABC transporter ATP-binding protein UgpC [Hahella ganghwensis]
MAALEIDNVRKVFGGKTEVLKGINISIENGEFLILVGPSGCGKSTLMNSIAGLESITDGQIRIGGEDVSGRSPKDRDIAMVFQSYALYPSMNVRDNIAFGLEMRKVPKEDRLNEVNRVAKMLQIEHLLDRKPSQLSGGQRQRVAMGRALARKPKIYLFDEPLSNLDAKLRVEMRTEIKKLHQNLGTTIVYVTHDQIEAMTLADRIAVMKDGIVQQFGTPQEIYDEPANIFVAGFMGSPAMNFIPAPIQKEQGQLVAKVTTAGGQTYSLPLGKRGENLEKYEGRKVILGVRPERISEVNITEVEREDVVVVKTKTEIVEPTGPDTLIHITLNGVEVGCRVAPDSAVKAGEDMEFMVDLSKAVFFDSETEARI